MPGQNSQANTLLAAGGMIGWPERRPNAGLRIAYEAMAWSTINHYTPDAWQTLKNVGEKNLGMVIDAFHIFVRHRTATDLEGILAEQIFLASCDRIRVKLLMGALRF